MGKKKPGVVRIPSDDLPTQEGRWVEMSAYVKRKHLPYLSVMGTTEQSILTDPNASAEDKIAEMRKMDDFLASFVVAWNWKDEGDNPYPKPANDPDAFGELRQEEYGWIVGEANKIIAEEPSAVPKENATS